VRLSAVANDPLEREAEPVACGLPWPRGVLHDDRQLRLDSGSGRYVPLQTSVLDRWSDGSVRWILLRWQATLKGSANYEVHIAPASENPPVVARALRIDKKSNSIRIFDQDMEYVTQAGGSFPFAASTISDVPLLNVSRTGLVIVDADGSPARAVVNKITLEESGPLYARVRVDCGMVGEGRIKPMRVCARLAFFAGSSTVQLDITLHNSRRAMHPGGIWELGDPGSLLFRSASLRLALPAGDNCSFFCSPERGARERSYALPFELYQDSSGGENWQSRVHLNRDDVVPVQFRGYRTRAGDVVVDGLRAEPVVRLEIGERRVSAVMRSFWPNFPKAIEADPEALTLHMFPPQSGDLHELQGGEQKTHTLFVAFGADRVMSQSLEWCRAPLKVRAEPQWYCETGAVPHLLPAGEAGEAIYEELVASAVAGPQSFVANRERIDEYGWRNFGDIYADHEAAYYRGPEPIVSHYNNQYDAIAGLARQFMRTGDFRWWDLMEELALHVVDIDVYHTDEDKSAYNHGLFWHTTHYVHGGKSTHRTFPRVPGVAGGGPANEHNYTSGLALHYFLTGNPLSRETVLELGRWVIDMDDGAKTVFHWLARGPTGRASMTADPDYHGPGRGAGNSVNALLDTFQLTRDRAYLYKAEELIRRCIHPHDDVAARNLENVELRWSYIVFLQELGRYLDTKAELGERNAMYAYARGALLEYARWMAACEYPYLEKPEILEFPTETWAAQDIRKSDVFGYAALHATGDERARFHERATYFFRHSVTELRSMDTRTRARPVVILLGNGTMDPWLRKNPDDVAPLPDGAPFADRPPQKFVSQKKIAIRRGILLAVISSFAALSGWLLW
jgi:hypothetical protein